MNFVFQFAAGVYKVAASPQALPQQKLASRILLTLLASLPAFILQLPTCPPCCFSAGTYAAVHLLCCQDPGQRRRFPAMQCKSWIVQPGGTRGRSQAIHQDGKCCSHLLAVLIHQHQEMNQLLAYQASSMGTRKQQLDRMGQGWQQHYGALQEKGPGTE